MTILGEKFDRDVTLMVDNTKVDCFFDSERQETFDPTVAVEYCIGRWLYDVAPDMQLSVVVNTVL